MVAETDRPQASRNLIMFRLDRQVFALPIESIIQIVEMVTVVPIPQVNHSVEGVINYHGKAIPAVNLSRHLGLPVAPLGVDTHIIVANSDGRTVGLLVDAVLSVDELPGAHIARPGDILPDGLGEVPFLSGVAHTAEGMVFVLDLERLFLDQPLPQLAEAIDALAHVDDEQPPEDIERELEAQA
jgi:purine-binding chemotaxis protein CheW